MARDSSASFLFCPPRPRVPRSLPSPTPLGGGGQSDGDSRADTRERPPPRENRRRCSLVDSGPIYLVSPVGLACPHTREPARGVTSRGETAGVGWLHLAPKRRLNYLRRGART